MANGKAKVFLSGARLVWRRQRIVWWIFVVDLFLSWHAIAGLVSHAHDILDHSLASAALVHRFDISVLGEMSLQPGISPLQTSNASMGYGAVFLVFMLFITGGILDVYRRDTTLSTTDFFEAGAAFFWRFVRLLIYFLLCLIPAAVLMRITMSVANHISQTAISPMASVWFRVGGGAVVLLYLLIARLWFDMAEVHSVAQNEKRMYRALGAAARMTFGNFASLFWLYIRIGIVGWIGFGVGLWLWMFVLRPDAIFTALILSQAMIVWWIATRLWQRASETLWYGERAPLPEPVPVPAPVYAAAHIQTQGLTEDI